MSEILYNIPWVSANRTLLSHYDGVIEDAHSFGIDAVCFIDGDARFTTYNWGELIEREYDRFHEEYPIMTCKTNRVNQKYQCVDVMWNVSDEVKHREQGAYRCDNFEGQITDITDSPLMSGHFILVDVKAYRFRMQYEVAREINKGTHKLLGADNALHRIARDKGLKVGMLESVYIEHYYRGGRREFTKHLEL